MKLVDVDELLFEINTSLWPQSMEYTKAVAILKGMLKAAPEAVVRCKDCKYTKRKSVIEGYFACGLLKQTVGDNDFCSFGERRENDDKA